MRPPTTHVATLSAGGGSWLTAMIVKRELVEPQDTFLMVFNDTLYEDADAYRFLLEGACKIMGVDAAWVPQPEDFPDYRVLPVVENLDDYHGNPEWRAFLADLRETAAERLPNLVWLVEGRDPWEVFRDERYLVNSSADPCSKIQKRELMADWLASACTPSETVLYFGINDAEKHRYEDWNEKLQRFTGIKPSWAARGWRAEAPLIGRVEGEISPRLYMQNAGIRPGRQYGLGYAHDNCGGMCGKAGQKHWKNRLETQPERYAYDEAMEALFNRHFGFNASFLKDRRKRPGETKARRRSLTLRQWRERLEADPDAPLPPPEPGEDGCGCMTEEPAT